MLSFNPLKKNCTGCTACYSACPVNCITMKPDEEGFLYPFATDECINCGKCEKVCPIVKPRENNGSFEKKVYAGLSKDKDIWRRSASGGAFSEICRAWDDGNTLFAGAAWDGLGIHHICVVGFENIGPLCKSKYMASSVEDTFRKIKKHLENGGKALFSGTPCQVDGLKNYLGKDWDSLLLVDFICHGVGSPKVFRQSIKAMEKQFGKKIVAYEFRSKRRMYEMDHLNKISFEDGSEKYVTDDKYMQLFLKQTAHRPSCGQNCIYRTENRPGDITVADFRGMGKAFPEKVGSKKNYSSVVINNEKAEKIVEKIKENMDMNEYSIEILKEFNPLFYRHTWFSEIRDSFFEEFVKDAEGTLEKWTKPAVVFKKRFAKKLFDALPGKVRNCVLRKLRDVKRIK